MSKTMSTIALSVMLMLTVFTITGYAAVYNMSYNVLNDFYSGSGSYQNEPIIASYIEQVNCEYLTSGEDTRTYVRIDYENNGTGNINIAFGTSVDTDYLENGIVYTASSSGTPTTYTVQTGDRLDVAVVYYIDQGTGYEDFYLPFEWQGASGEYSWSEAMGETGTYAMIGSYVNNAFLDQHNYNTIYLSSGNL